MALELNLTKNTNDSLQGTFGKYYPRPPSGVQGNNRHTGTRQAHVCPHHLVLEG